MQQLAGLQVLILGLGQSGLAMARWCARWGAQVTVWDSREQPPQAQFEAGQGVAALPVNPTAALVTRLFQEKDHGGIVEVHIAGGSVILPEFYEPRWSAGSHGLFASRAADGTVTLTAVAWDSIQKIIVRQVNGLPDGMFE